MPREGPSANVSGAIGEHRAVAVDVAAVLANERTASGWGARASRIRLCRRAFGPERGTLLRRPRCGCLGARTAASDDHDQEQHLHDTSMRPCESSVKRRAMA